MTAANWHPDPTGRHELRYWDGNQWTEHVSNRGVVSADPLQAPAAPEQAQASQDLGGAGAVGDVGGIEEERQEQVWATESPAETQVIETHAPDASGGQQPVDLPGDGASEAGAPAYAPSEPSQPVQSVQPVQPSQPAPAYAPSQDGFAGISGELIDGRFSEVSGTGATLQNKRLLRVRIDQPFLAKQGSMVAYQGSVDFAYQGSGAARFLKKAFTGEGLSLMQVTGQGDVFLADEAREVHVLHLTNSGLSVNGKNVLGFSASLDWNVERVRGGSMAAGGLFNTTLRGTGWVAITTDGEPVVLNAQEAPTFADANALVAWSVQLQTSIRSTFTAGSLIGRGSGEAFQVAFQGPGFVIVQPSEGSSVPPHTH